MLKINCISVYYGNFRALEDVSLEINKGELVALIGSNGAGKTTLLMTISGILKPVNGSIEFFNKRIDNIEPFIISNLGISHVPQGRQLFYDMTVEENIELGAYINRKHIKERLENVYEKFNILYERRKQKAGTLSGGEQQMVAIARALMSDPRLILLDEPSMGLAPVVIETITKIIEKLSEGGLSILLVEQNANLALEISNRGYVLETGTIVLHDKAHNLLTNKMVKTAYLGLA